MKDVIDRFELRQHHLDARRGGAAVRAGPERLSNADLHPDGAEPDDGDHLRGADPALQRAIQRKPRRALHAPRGRSPDGRPADHRRRGADPEAARAIRTIFDCGCGSGGMLTIGKDHMLGQDQPGCRYPAVRPGGQRRNLRGLQIGLVHEVVGRPRRRLPRAARDAALSRLDLVSSERNRNLPASVLARLSNRARQTGEDYQVLLNAFVCERFLHRLGASQAADRFVLKGAMLLRMWEARPYRATRGVGKYEAS